MHDNPPSVVCIDGCVRQSRNVGPYRYRLDLIDDVLSMNNPKFNDYTNVIHPLEFEIKDIIDALKWVNYLYFDLEFD